MRIEKVTERQPDVRRRGRLRWARPVTSSGARRLTHRAEAADSEAPKSLSETRETAQQKQHNALNFCTQPEVQEYS